MKLCTPFNYYSSKTQILIPSFVCVLVFTLCLTGSYMFQCSIYATFEVEFRRDSPVLSFLPVWDHSSHGWIPVGQHSGPCHLFKVCHSGLCGSLRWQRWPFSHSDMHSILSPSVHHELSAGASAWNRSIWDCREICQKAQCFATEPGTGSMCPVVMNPACSSSPGGNLARCESLLSIRTLS